MFAHLVRQFATLARVTAQALHRHLLAITKPTATSLVVGTLADVVRSKSALIAENALLRQQLIILRRSVKRPHCTGRDRTLLVLLTSRLRTWRHAVLIVQPETVLRWHRQLFRQFWRRRSSEAPPQTDEIYATQKLDSIATSSHVQDI